MANRTDSILPMASLYVGDLHPDVTEALLYEKFITAGQIVSLRICRDSTTNKSLGYAYVNFSLYSDAEKVLDTMNFDMLKGKPMRIMWSQRDPSLRKSGIGNIFIKNLDKTIDNKAMYDTFSAFGNILSCKVALDEDGNSKGYGFVHFDRAESAKIAIEKVNGMLLNSKKVYVGHFIPRTEREKVINKINNLYTNIFIKNFAKNFTEDNLYNLFSKFGKITSCVVMKNLDGTSKCFGFVNYENHISAEEATQKMNDYEMDDGNYLYVGRAQTKAERELELKRNFEQLKLERHTRVQGANIYIKQLDDLIDDEKLHKEFSIFGTITSAKIMMENGRSKGFGFVCFSTADQANRAISEMNGRIFGRKPIYVALAQRKEDRRAYLTQLCMQRLRYQTSLTYTAIPPFLLPTIQQGPRFYNHLNQTRAAPRWPSVQGTPPPPPPLRINGTYLPIIQSPNNYRQNLRPLQNNNNRNNTTNNIIHPRPITGQQLLTRPNSRYSTTNSNLLRSFNVSSSNNGGDNITNNTLTNSAINNTGGVDEKRILGEHIFRITEKEYPDLASKITGMLLELELTELKDLLGNPNSLRLKTEEAVNVLNDYEGNKIITEPSTDL